MCLHENVIDTYPECDIVCADCAFVIGKTYSDALYKGQFPLIVDEIDDIIIHELLTDVVHNLNLPENCIEPSKIKYKEHRLNKDLRKFKNHELACFSIYNELIEQENPTFLEDLCAQCNVNQSQIWNIQKAIDNFADLEPRLLVSRIVSELEIPYVLTDRIYKNIEKLEEISSAKPETILACAIYIETEINDNISLHSICQQCRVSKSSVLSLFRRYGLSTR